MTRDLNTSDETDWIDKIIIMIENPLDSSLWTPTISSCQPPLKSLNRGSTYSHCSDGACWEKHAYILSNWIIPNHICDNAASLNCGYKTRHPCCAWDRPASPSSQAASIRMRHDWVLTLPTNLYVKSLAAAGHFNSPHTVDALRHKFAIHLGSGTGSMKRSLLPLGIFVINIDKNFVTQTAFRDEHASIVTNFDHWEHNFPDLALRAIHTYGFAKSDVIMIAFDPDCKTRSVGSRNTNHKYRDPNTKLPQPDLIGYDESITRDRIDLAIIKWLDSISRPHQDSECIDNITRWPSSTGSWGIDAAHLHTCLTCPPKWLHPQITGQHYRTKLRTKYNQNDN